ncbi:MAG: hypothetical protein D6781_08840 [Verrucomicrobia bacterium]|nr:MAG: hypothetical protein D6781_08840 [Verrucomicrobiota bacterium]
MNTKPTVAFPGLFLSSERRKVAPTRWHLDRRPTGRTEATNQPTTAAGPAKNLWAGSRATGDAAG